MKLIRRPGILELDAKLNSILQFQRDDDRSGGGFGLGTAGVIGAGGLGITGAGLYGAGVAVQRGGVNMKTNLGNIGGAARGDIASIGQGGLGRIGRTIATGAKEAPGIMRDLIARARGIKMSARATNIVELNAKLDGVLEFREEEESHKLRNTALIGAGAAGAGTGGLYVRGRNYRQGLEGAGWPAREPGAMNAIRQVGSDIKIGGALTGVEGIDAVQRGAAAVGRGADYVREKGSAIAAPVRSAYGATKGRVSSAGKRVGSAASGTKAALQAQLDKALAKLAKLRK